LGSSLVWKNAWHGESGMTGEPASDQLRSLEQSLSSWPHFPLTQNEALHLEGEKLGSNTAGSLRCFSSLPSCGIEM